MGHDVHTRPSYDTTTSIELSGKSSVDSENGDSQHSAGCSGTVAQIGPHSVKSPVPRKQDLENPNRNTAVCSTWQPRRTEQREQTRYIYPILSRHLMMHSEFSPLVCDPTSGLSCAGGKRTTGESEPVASPPTLTLHVQANFPIQCPHLGPSTCLCSRSPRYVARCPDVLYRSSWRPKTVGSTPTHPSRACYPLHHGTTHQRSAT